MLIVNPIQVVKLITYMACLNLKVTKQETEGGDISFESWNFSNLYDDISCQEFVKNEDIHYLTHLKQGRWNFLKIGFAITQ